MAVVQYGSIITEIKGSLGGHTFKSQRGTKVIMQKSNGYSKSKQLSNRALGYAGYIFQLWKNLNESYKANWDNEASTILWPDKYGNQVTISGRELFTKLNLQLGAGYYIENPTGDFSPFVSTFLLTDASISATPQSATVAVTVDSEAGSYFDITAEVSVSRLNAPVFRTRALLKREALNTAGIIDFTTGFFTKFPFVTDGYFVRFYITILNQYGFKGGTQFINLVVGQVLPIFDFTKAVIEQDGALAVLTIEPDLSAEWQFYVSAHVSSNTSPSNDFATSTNLGVYTQSQLGIIEIEDQLLIAFPDLSPGDYVRFFVMLSQGGQEFGVYQELVTPVPYIIPDYTLVGASVTSAAALAELAVSANDLTGFTMNVYALINNGSPPIDAFDLSVLLGNFDIVNSQDIFLQDAVYNEYGFLTASDYVRFYSVLVSNGVEVSEPQTITTQVQVDTVTWVLTGFDVVQNADSSRFFYSGSIPTGYIFRVRALEGTVSNPPNDFSLSSLIGTFDPINGSPVNMGSAISDVLGSIPLGRLVRIWVVVEISGVEIGEYQNRFNQVAP